MWYSIGDSAITKPSYSNKREGEGVISNTENRRNAKAQRPTSSGALTGGADEEGEV